MVEPTVVAAIAAAGALLFAVVGGLVGILVRHHRRRAPSAPAASPVATGARPGGDVTTRMAAALRRRPWVRRALSASALVMVAVALGLLGYPVFTDVVQGRIQTRLEQQLASPQFRQVYLAGEVAEGDSVTRLRIPAIGVDTVVVEGTTESALRAGAGHYPGTPLPCQDGNVGIAGHRTTYGHPFRNLDQLHVGDEIILETPIGSCVYRLSQAPFAVAPTETSVVAPSPDALLTLTTCHPVGSASQRLVARAALVTTPGEEA
jgi:sortase A